MSGGGAQLRVMGDGDLDAAARAVAAAFDWTLTDDLLARMRYRLWRIRGAHPEGAFVTEVDGVVNGIAQAVRYTPDLWVLSLLGVDPATQGSGAGRLLLDAALGYRRPGDQALIVSSNAPAALRLYARAGLTGHPTFKASGPVTRSRLPALGNGLKLGILTEDDDLDFLNPVTTAVRGAPYGEDLRFLLERGGRLLHAGDRGWALLDAHGVGGLVAADVSTARALLWRGLAEADPTQPVELRWLTAAQSWAVEIALAAGLALETYGALFVGASPGTLAPFLPTGPFA